LRNLKPQWPRKLNLKWYRKSNQHGQSPNEEDEPTSDTNNDPESLKQKRSFKQSVYLEVNRRLFETINPIVKSKTIGLSILGTISFWGGWLNKPSIGGALGIGLFLKHDFDTGINAIYPIVHAGKMRQALAVFELTLGIKSQIFISPKQDIDRITAYDTFVGPLVVSNSPDGYSAIGKIVGLSLPPFWSYVSTFETTNLTIGIRPLKKSRELINRLNIVGPLVRAKDTVHSSCQRLRSRTSKNSDLQ